MTRPPDQMSTIEKAAAKLTSRHVGNAGIDKPREPGAPSAGGRDFAETVPARSSRSSRESRVLFTPAHHFCDIDQQLLQNKGFLNPHSRRSQLAQEMRRIKRPLLLNIQKAGAIDSTLPPANLIMITSALPGEGKTFISINLALSMASELDRRVLLVDADVARGDVSRQLELPPSRGLSDLLQESNYLGEDGVKTSNIERLSILPAGEPVDHIDELFASEMMSHITLALAEADPQRVVIFDAPPLIHTTEAAVLARRMGQTVVVVEANRTPQAAVRQALAQLEECPNVSLVLNKATGKSAAGYGYGYGYGSDGRSTSDEVAAGGRPQQPE